MPLLGEVIRFRTTEKQPEARAAEQAWIVRTARGLGLEAGVVGLVTEVELRGPQGAPVIGLVVHGDVQPADDKSWHAPPFEGEVRDGKVWGRGSADDKGPLVQALLALASLKASGAPLTHTLRLLVGSDEESDNEDIKSYLLGRSAPDYSLILDANFPATVGEKAWEGLAVSAPPEEKPRPGAEKFAFTPVSRLAGISPSIVPDRATLVLKSPQGSGPLLALSARLREREIDQGTTLTLELREAAAELSIAVTGHAAHNGMNLTQGRNALVALAHLVEGLLPPGPIDDLLAFARLAGQDHRGTGLGLPAGEDPIWGHTTVCPSVVKKGFPQIAAPGQDDHDTLVINLRRIPPLTGAQSHARLVEVVTAFNARTGAHLVPGGWFEDEPLAFNPRAKLVERLMQSYRRASKRDDPPAITGGGTYAKRFPRSIAFGMWFPDKPYPGHDVDEANPISDLELGSRVLIDTLVDLATGAPLRDPFVP